MADRRRRRITGIVVFAGLVVAACGGSTALPSPSLSPSSAATTSPSTVAPATQGTASPSALPAPTPAPSGTLEPDQRAAEAALGEFAALASDPELSLRLDQAGSFEGTGPTADFAYGIDIAGSDFAAVMTLAGETAEVRAVSGYGYVKAGGADWVTTEIDADTAGDITNPWRYLGDLNALKFVSRAPAEPDAFLFANSAPISYQTGAMRRNGLTGKITELTFVVLPDGTPVELRFTAQSPDGQNGTVAIKSSITFSKVGEPIAIEKPKPSP